MAKKNGTAENDIINGTQGNDMALVTTRFKRHRE